MEFAMVDLSGLREPDLLRCSPDVGRGIFALRDRVHVYIVWLPWQAIARALGRYGQ